MNLQKVVLKRTVTADGLCGLNDDIKIGKEYIVDLDRRMLMKYGHTDGPTVEERHSIWAFGDNGVSSGWMPTEFFGV